MYMGAALQSLLTSIKLCLRRRLSILGFKPKSKENKKEINININEIQNELLCENMISSTCELQHVIFREKITVAMPT